uniref:Vesicular inhibitory amino acid transporter n=1 Tax=Acanthochromis polyacanthus TaxID=80966 RepID=A0A3Q1GAI5_9TELE
MQVGKYKTQNSCQFWLRYLRLPFLSHALLTLSHSTPAFPLAPRPRSYICDCTVCDQSKTAKVSDMYILPVKILRSPRQFHALHENSHFYSCANIIAQGFSKHQLGIFVLGLPFALVQSGYVGLVLLVLSAWICNHTGRTLVACLYEEERRSVCSLVSLVFLLPCLLLTDLRPVSTLSLLCSLAHILISLLVMLYCLSRASSWSWSSLSLSVDPENFIVSVGVIIFSYTSQIFLPPLEGSMEDRGQFNSMLGWTHGAACIMKTMFSLLAVLTWGTETSEVITDNLPSDLRPLVNLCLLAKALLSYPLPFYSAAEILQTCVQDGTQLTALFDNCRGVSRPALVVRGALLITSYLLALLVPRFSLLMGLTGSVTGAAMTLILPCLFHLRLQWGCLTVKDRLIDVGILGLGVICSVSGVICSIKRLVETL